MMKVVHTTHITAEKSKQVDKLLSQSNFDMMNIQLKAGEEIPTHHADRDVVVILRTGKVSFTVEEETVELTNDNVLYMTPLENHSLVAIEDADIIVLKIK